uniref:Uncharacterized protein n=1 Tax=Anguilla anguilla TaxID=7936 RepID=A0A0E9STQ1_ANGAN
METQTRKKVTIILRKTTCPSMHLKQEGAQFFMAPVCST